MQTDVDYIIRTEDGGEFVIETNDPGTSRKRLEAYYNALLQHDAKAEDEQTKKTIDYFISSMDDEEVIELEVDVAKKDSKYVEVASTGGKDTFESRILTYMTKIHELSSAQKEISEPVQEIVDKYKSFDFDSIVMEEINGNMFSYKKDEFPIEQFRKELEEMGNKSKGNHWSVSISSDGRLVIY